MLKDVRDTTDLPPNIETSIDPIETALYSEETREWNFKTNDRLTRANTIYHKLEELELAEQNYDSLKEKFDKAFGSISHAKERREILERQFMSRT